MVYRKVSLSLGSLALVAATMAGPIQGAGASDAGGAYVVTRQTPARLAEAGPTYRPIDVSRRTKTYVVHRPVVEPAAVVSRSLSEQPVLPHLVEVDLGGTTILVDPLKRYPRLDENHTIRWAQRMHEFAQPAKPARVIRRPNLTAEPSAERPPHPLMPRAIFLHPDYMDRLPEPPAPPAEKRDRPTLPEVQDRDGPPVSPQAPMPHVPAPPREKADLFVMSD